MEPGSEQGAGAHAGTRTVGGELAGHRILLTGASGFLGKAVLAALLERAPRVASVALLLRCPDRDSAERRLREDVLASDAIKGFSAAESWAAEGKLRALPGDLEHDGLGSLADEELRDLDTVIHCAATVSFEEPLDDAVRLNALGPIALLDRLRAAGAAPHIVHVSTAYVAEGRSGVVGEDGLPHPRVAALDPDELMALGGRWRREAEAAADATRQAGRLTRASRRDSRRRTDLDAGARESELRDRWVQSQLSERARRHAVASGWPDTYAMSKALGEHLLAERAGGEVRLTIVRPSIIESALARPRPGWLEGIKVADPLILAYASRALTHLPGARENRIDIVPVDYVANACVAAAAFPPEREVRALALGSSARNPLQIGRLADHIRDYFRAHPLTRRDGREIRIGELDFVSRRRAVRVAERRELLARALARAAVASPVGFPGESVLRRNAPLAARVTRMVKIYGPYTELDCAFDDTNTQALWHSLDEGDQAALPFDTAAIDWHAYLQGIHLPEVRRLAGGA